MLPQRKVGSLTLPVIGLGCMNLSHAYLPVPAPGEAARLLNRALDLGVSHLDTAALYGFGRNERLLGDAVMHRRKEFTLASKCVLAEIDGKRGLNGRPEALTRTVDDALGRLGTDFIDLYYLHRLDPHVPIEESMGALVRAKDEGKIGAIGVSEMSAATIRRAHAVHPLAAVQTEYSVCVRNAEVAVLDACAELGIGFVAFSPLVRGLMTGRIGSAEYQDGDIRAAMPRFVEPNLARNLAHYARFRAVAAQAGITPAQLCLCWLLSRRPFVVAIPGTTSIAHLEENVAAAALDPGEDVLAAVDAIFPPGAMAGPRYNAAAQSQIDTELLPEEIAADPA